MFEFDIICAKIATSEQLRGSQFHNFLGGACPQTPLGGHAYLCHGLTLDIHHSLAALLKPNLSKLENYGIDNLVVVPSM